MAEIRGQQRQAHLDIAAVSVPRQESVTDEDCVLAEFRRFFSM